MPNARRRESKQINMCVVQITVYREKYTFIARSCRVSFIPRITRHLEYIKSRIARNEWATLLVIVTSKASVENFRCKFFLLQFSCQVNMINGIHLANYILTILLGMLFVVNEVLDVSPVCQTVFLVIVAVNIIMQFIYRFNQLFQKIYDQRSCGGLFHLNTLVIDLVYINMYKCYYKAKVTPKPYHVQLMYYALFQCHDVIHWPQFASSKLSPCVELWSGYGCFVYVNIRKFDKYIW